MDGVLLNLCQLSDATTYDTSRQNIIFKADIVNTPTTTNFSFRLTIFFSTVTPGLDMFPKGRHWIIIEARFFSPNALPVAQQTLSTHRR